MVALALVLVWTSAVAQLPAERSIPTENPSSAPRVYTEANGTLYFVADDGIHGREPWWCRIEDGEVRSGMLGDFAPGHASSDPHGMIADGRWVCLDPLVPGLGREVWVWDAETREARLLEDIAPGEGDGTILFQRCVDGQVLFEYTGQGKWIGDLEEGGVRPLSEESNEPVTALSASGWLPEGTRIYAVGKRLWREDTVTGEVAELVAGENPEDIVGIGAFAVLASRLVFTVTTTEYGEEPWVSDGTPEGTFLLRDIGPGGTGAGLSGFTPYHGRLYFGADDGEHGVELWATDGTRAGTVLVKDITPGRSGSNPHWLGCTSRFLFFLANDGVHGKELWQSDGTPEGTRMVADLFPGPTGSEPWKLCPVGDRFYFGATTPNYGEEVFYTDGTREGTGILKDIVPGAESSGPYNLANVNGVLFFTCNDGIHGEELWMSDGTPEGTCLAVDISPPRFNPSSHPEQLTALGDHVLFVANDAAHGREVWRSDGTVEGTCLVKDAVPGPLGSNPDRLTVAAGHVFFVAGDTVTGRGLRCSDGSVDGTRRVPGTPAGRDGSVPEILFGTPEALLFTVDDGRHGRELWRSDGTAEGTGLLGDLTPGPGSTVFLDAFSFRGVPYAYTADEDGATALWRIDTSASTAIKVARSAGGAFPRALRPVEAGSGDGEVLLSEEEVTVLGLLFPVPSAGSAAKGLPGKRPGATPVTLDDVTFFVNRDERHGAELWKTDGTLGGISLVLDAFPGPGSSSPNTFLVQAGRLYFFADHPSYGRVLWRSDGTAAGTGVVEPRTSGIVLWPIEAIDMAVAGETMLFSARDIPRTENPRGREKVEIQIVRAAKDGDILVERRHIRGGQDGSWPRELTTAGGQIFFTADDGTHGRELWVLDGETTETRLVKDILPPGALSPLHR